MSSEPTAFLALTRFELRRGIARREARIGLVILVLALLYSVYRHWSADDPPASLFAYGFIVWLMGLIAYGMDVDRRQKFDLYLLRNHVRPRVYLIAKIVAVVALILLAGAVGFLLRFAASGQVELSLWWACLMTLLGLLVAPLAMVLEGQVDTPIPAAFVMLAYGFLGGFLYFVRHTTILFDLPGLTTLMNGNWSSLAPMARSAGLWVVPAFAVAGMLVHWTQRRRL